MTSAMYFVNEQHETNYRNLLGYYSCSDNMEYKSACYCVAVPEIYRKAENALTKNSPVDWAFGKWNSDLGHHEESDCFRTLSSTYANLMRAAATVFSGSDRGFALHRIADFDDRVFQLFLNTLKIYHGEF